MKKTFSRVKEFYEKYERYFSPVAFLAGFTWDNLTLKRIDLWFENLVLGLYLVLIFTSIVFINFREARRSKFQAGGDGAMLVPYVMQFAFGGIFSGFFVFYSRSAELASSWPFLLFLIAILIGNEFFRSKYSRFTFQISIFFIALFSYAIFIIPILTGKMGDGIFLASGLISLTVLAIILLAVKAVLPVYARQNWTALLIAIPAIFITFNLFYFTNIIPPIPLSLKEIGVYHSITKTGPGTYEAEYEPLTFTFLNLSPAVFHRYGDGFPYVFSAVFAPTKINTEIFHRWQYYDEDKNEWTTVSRVSYGIVGGRDGGYRGYSWHKNVFPGTWRVDVETERGQLIGRIKFEVADSDAPPKTLTRIK